MSEELCVKGFSITSEEPTISDMNPAKVFLVQNCTRMRFWCPFQVKITQKESLVVSSESIQYRNQPLVAYLRSKLYKTQPFVASKGSKLCSNNECEVGPDQPGSIFIPFHLARFHFRLIPIRFITFHKGFKILLLVEKLKALSKQ